MVVAIHFAEIPVAYCSMSHVNIIIVERYWIPHENCSFLHVGVYIEEGLGYCLVLSITKTPF